MAKANFEEDPEIAARVSLIKQITADYDRGNVLLWEVVEAVLGIPRADDRLKYAVLKWRKYCHNELRIETWAVPGRGIKLLTHSEQVAMVPQRRAKRAYRQHGMILRSIRNTNFDSLSDHERLMAKAAADHSLAARKQAKQIGQAAKGNVGNDRAALIARAKRIAEEAKTE